MAVTKPMTSAEVIVLTETVERALSDYGNEQTCNNPVLKFPDTPEYRQVLQIAINVFRPSDKQLQLTLKAGMIEVGIERALNFLIYRITTLSNLSDANNSLPYQNLVETVMHQVADDLQVPGALIVWAFLAKLDATTAEQVQTAVQARPESEDWLVNKHYVGNIKGYGFSFTRKQQ